MIVAIAAGQSPNLTLNPFVPVETMTAYIVQVSLGDTPTGTLEFKTIFAVGMTLFLLTLVLNVLSQRLVRRFRERYE
jgi:phosphate transport system permease protein